LDRHFTALLQTSHSIVQSPKCDFFPNVNTKFAAQNPSVTQTMLDLATMYVLEQIWKVIRHSHTQPMPRFIHYA